MAHNVSQWSEPLTREEMAQIGVFVNIFYLHKPFNKEAVSGAGGGEGEDGEMQGRQFTG